MAENIAKIHQEVFNLLISYHEKDPEFLFTLRKINRKSRLDKGYWFLGNDYYLTVSFWRGTDWITRMPIISFTILVSGQTYLEMNSKFVSNKTDFFKESFIKELWIDDKESEYGFRKYYPQFGPEDYIKSLDNFIHNDKSIIDKAIIKDQVFWPDALRFGDPVEPLWQGNFKRELQKVRHYQEKVQKKVKRTGYLKYISVENFGPIERLQINNIPDECRWIFLTGENGTGKTSFLRAIATGLCNNIDENEKIWVDIKRFIIKLGLTGLNSVEHYAVNYSDKLPERKWLPRGLAMYGPVRLFSQEFLSSGIFREDNNDIQKASFGLFHSIGLLKDLSVPLKLTSKPKYHEVDVEWLINNIVENLKFILPNIFNISIEEDDEKIKLTYFQAVPNKEKNIIVQGVPFERLPSGSRNIAAIILDLMIRFREQQPEVTDIAEYNGIVIIDEIDLHLHPKLQKELVKQLSETFPNIQFIVTTHSPIPLLGAPKDSMFITIYKDQDYKICAENLNIDVTNMLPNTILSSPIFDFNALDSINHQERDRFITEDNYSEALFYKILTKKIKERSLRLSKDDSSTF